MSMQDQAAPPAAEQDAPRRGRPPKSETELKARVEELETRQGEIIDVLAGTSQAGGWLKRQYLAGERA